MGTGRPQGLTLDAGALIAFERVDEKVRALLEETAASGRSIHVSAGVIAQTWRGGGRQALLARLLRSAQVRIHPLDGRVAMAVGVLAARSGVADVVDCHVALVARSTGSVVVTSDPEDLARIDPTLILIAC